MVFAGAQKAWTIPFKESFAIIETIGKVHAPTGSYRLEEPAPYLRDDDYIRIDKYFSVSSSFRNSVTGKETGPSGVDHSTRKFDQPHCSISLFWSNRSTIGSGSSCLDLPTSSAATSSNPSVTSAHRRSLDCRDFTFSRGVPAPSVTRAHISTSQGEK